MVIEIPTAALFAIVVFPVMVMAMPFLAWLEKRYPENKTPEV